MESWSPNPKTPQAQRQQIRRQEIRGLRRELDGLWPPAP